MDVRFLSLAELERAHFYRAVTLSMLVAIGILLLIRPGDASPASLALVGAGLGLLAWRFAVEWRRLGRCVPVVPDGEALLIVGDATHRRIALVTMGSIVITAISLAVVWGLLAAWGQEPRHVAPPTAPRTIASLEQTLILHTERGVELRNAQAASLDRWEWVDRDAGVARIPVETAIDILVAAPPASDRGIEPRKKEERRP